MQHAIDTDSFKRGQQMADAIGACVHCGFCLPSCPTYQTMGEEMDSPRGRILLIKEVLEGELELEAALPYIDNCLGCQACVTACPSGVPYGDLLTSFRLHSEPIRKQGLWRRARRRLTLATLTRPRRLRLSARAGRLARPLAPLLPRGPREMLELLPHRLPAAHALPARIPAQGAVRARVALLTGCAQQVLAPQIAAATARVLARNGVEVLVAPDQGCCGALAMHTGDEAKALAAARHNLDALAGDVDAIVTTAAGCGSAMKEYGLLFAGDRDEPRASAFAEKVVDAAVLLDQLGLSTPPPALPEPVRVAYHDACHLAHAQAARSAPRALLGQIGGVELVEPPEWEICCGSAGTYNIERPAVARELGRRKAQNLISTQAGIIATGNIGCMVQIEAHLAQEGRPLPVLHTLELLDQAYSRDQKETDK